MRNLETAGSLCLIRTFPGASASSSRVSTFLSFSFLSSILCLFHPFLYLLFLPLASCLVFCGTWCVRSLSPLSLCCGWVMGSDSNPAISGVRHLLILLCGRAAVERKGTQASWHVICFWFWGRGT